jgi:3-hydroxyisobutyrate dehydrogenase-like beta-hydroxyacid dehydrogenase
MRSKIEKVGVIGYGEAGGILAAGLVAAGCRVFAFDILVNDASAREALRSKARAAGVILCESVSAAVRDAKLIISAVTANSAREVAEEVRPLLKAAQYFLDINSVAPHAKQDNGAKIESSGAHYVEAAVMAPVPPQGLHVPMLLGGPHAETLSEALRELGMNARAVSAELGVASAIKMCRSIMIKGMEALAIECLFTARRYGAEDAVLASLHASFPSLGWSGAFPDYLISRVAEHGRRRAAEMREVAATLEDVGMKPWLAMATAKRQDDLVDAMATAGRAYDATLNFSWRQLADDLHPHMK